MACQIFAAYSNGLKQALDGSLESQFFGIAFVSVVVITPFILPRAFSTARTVVGKAAGFLLWFIGFAFVLYNAATFTFSNRAEMVDVKVVKVGTYDLAKAKLERANGDRDKQKSNPRWDRTDGCTKIRNDADAQFCDVVRATVKEIHDAEDGMKGGKPRYADPAVHILSWITGVSEETVEMVLPIALAVTLECLASGVWWLALSGAESIAEPAVQITPLESVPEEDDRPSKTDEELYPELVFSDGSDYKPRALGRPLRPRTKHAWIIPPIDGRTLRPFRRPQNDNAPLGSATEDD